ncbi:hypothetical protein B7P43_G07627 [Cryptotermes secundus]|uniref:G-protein coupled receptors family 1 profile domain-containing protein n=2 Tax=Cryptotermes secundus TaxID=105785 RepID=A0A2J7RLH4_9NEOP|nr:hypothetical protein B7P43_G07627 [Cryptotermes secundus]
MTSGELAVKWTDNYAHCFQAMAAGGTFSQYISFQSELRNRELGCTEVGFKIIKEIYELAKMNIHIREYGKKEQNLTEQDTGEDVYECINELTSLLKDSITEHKLLLQKVTYVHSLMQSCMISSFNGSWICMLLSEEEWKKQISNKTDKLKHYEHKCEELKNERFFGYYVNPVIYSVIFLVGLVGNGSVLLIFAVEKDVRTKPNVMILNLVVGDTLNLLINIPLHYVIHYSYILSPLTGFSCHLLAMTRFLFFAVSALSVVSLSVQRYCIVVHTPWRHHTSRILVLYILSVWVLAIFVSLPETLIITEQKGMCLVYNARNGNIVLLLRFLFYCVACPCIMVILSVITARRLCSSTRDVPNQLCNSRLERSRKRSAKVLRILALVFVITYIPTFTWNFVSCWFQDALTALPNIVTASIDKVSYHLLFLNVCCNPVALYTASSAFRKPLDRYILRCCNKVHRKP